MNFIANSCKIREETSTSGYTAHFSSGHKRARVRARFGPAAAASTAIAINPVVFRAAHNSFQRKDTATVQQRREQQQRFWRPYKERRALKLYWPSWPIKKANRATLSAD